jgi:hypothetical protein
MHTYGIQMGLKTLANAPYGGLRELLVYVL